jgi:hypothetical protein
MARTADRYTPSELAALANLQGNQIQTVYNVLREAGLKDNDAKYGRRVYEGSDIRRVMTKNLSAAYLWACSSVGELNQTSQKKAITLILKSVMAGRRGRSPLNGMGLSHDRFIDYISGNKLALASNAGGAAPVVMQKTRKTTAKKNGTSTEDRKRIEALEAQVTILMRSVAQLVKEKEAV